MTESAILDNITTLIGSLGYWGIALLMFLENIIPPIPSEVIMPLAGFAISRGEMQALPAIFAGTIGSVAGATVWYYIGQWLGLRQIQQLARRYGKWIGVSSQDVGRVQRWFNRRSGYWAIGLGRLLPGIRTYISIPAGISGMSLGKFLLYSSIGSVAWIIFLTACGYWLGASYTQIGTVLGPISKWLLIAFILLLLGWILYRHLSGARKSE